MFLFEGLDTVDVPVSVRACFSGQLVFSKIWKRLCRLFFCAQIHPNKEPPSLFESKEGIAGGRQAVAAGHPIIDSIVPR